MTAASLQSAIESDMHIPIHTLSGQERTWANRLLAIFRGVSLGGVEWSMKFSATGLTANRFLLGISSENWYQLHLEQVRESLRVPAELWERILEDMQHARAMFFAYEPGEGAGTYRIYLEFTILPAVLQQQGVCPLGCGYKWDPEHKRISAVTVYRQRYLPDKQAFKHYLAPYFSNVQHSGIRHLAASLIDQAAHQTDVSNFMFLEVGETESQRDSFTVSFRGVDIPVLKHIPDFLQLAASLALPESQVLEHFLPNEPRSICSLGVGTGRDGHEFLTIYYD